MIRRESLPVTVALEKSKFGAMAMGKIKLLLGASILLLVSAQANAGLKFLVEQDYDNGGVFSFTVETDSCID